MAWETAGQIINDAAVEVGLAEVSDPYASVDPNFVQLCRLLKSCGRDLVNERDWTYLRKEHTFVTVQGTAAYDLPSDFNSMFDQTWWNRTNRLPLGGPLSPQEWQYLKSRIVGVVFTVLFRPMQQQIYLYPDTDTPGDYTIAFEYKSSAWVQPTGQTVATLDAPTAATDTIWFEPNLIVRALKLAFLKAKGFDTTAAQQDFDRSLERAAGDDAPSAILSLNNTSPLRGVDRMIGQQSVPITGFGS